MIVDLLMRDPSLLLEKCTSPITFKQIHAHFIITGLILHTFPLSRILHHSSLPPLSYAIGTGLSYAFSIFNQILNPSIFLYNTLISSAAITNHTHKAFSLYNQILRQKTLRPNNFTYPSLFKACGSHSWLLHGRGLHCHVIKFLGPTCDNFVVASLLNFYSKCGELGVARYLFDEMLTPDLAAWNSIIVACARTRVRICGDDTSSLLEALFLFNEMLVCGVRPNEITLVAVISACAETGALTQGMWAHGYLERSGLEVNRFVGTALIEMYAKCGSIGLSVQVFDMMRQRDTQCYNAMILGLASHGHGQQALDLLRTMWQEGIDVDDVTFVAVISGCAHAGLVEEGLSCFNSMVETHRIEPKIEHYGCLIDLLGRAGRLHDAEEVIREMPMKPNAVLWRSLLGACRIHDHLELGELAIRHLMQLEPDNGGTYVLLSNIYANLNRWDDVRRIRKVMKDKGIDKMPGSSLVEMDGAIHEFIMGDRTHPRWQEIYGMLDEIAKRLQASGHGPITKEVLFDIDIEEKEDTLSFHSERIAIAFALVASNATVPIRIIKNLRICGDCHASIKLISKIYAREIIVRDRNRFHHFKYGICSCSDHW